MRDINLKTAPYYFSDKQIEKIEKMISSMTLLYVVLLVNLQL